MSELLCDIEAERTILGRIVHDNAAYYEAAAELVVSDFFTDLHQKIFICMGDLMESGKAIDDILLWQAIQRRGWLNAFGTSAMIVGLTNGVLKRAPISNHIRIVKDKSLTRRLTSIYSAAAERAGTEDGIKIGLDVDNAIHELIASKVKSSAKTLLELLPDAVVRFDQVANSPAGATLGASLITDEMDSRTSGIQETELCLIGARPGQGKTEAGLQACLRNARRGKRVYVQSLEMKSAPLLWRMWRLMAHIPITDMRDPRCLKPDQRQAIRLAQEEQMDLPIMIDETHEVTINEFRSKTILAARRFKADLIIVDYGQLLQVPAARGDAVKAAPKQAETLRHIARDYCRTLALVQLRRSSPNDLNKFPDIEDIFGASQWEQAAQLILLLHRTRKDREFTGEDYCFLGKMREGQWLKPFGIRCTPWGEFQERREGQKCGPEWRG